MKNLNILILLLSCSMVFFACEKVENAVDPKDEEEEMMTPIPGAILQGAFTGASGHTTTGTASISKDESGKNKLNLNDFKTDSGPDLRVYLAEDTKATNFIEITDDVKNGSNSYDIPSSVDLSEQKFVLIWCRAFSVNFGYTELVEPE